MIRKLFRSGARSGALLVTLYESLFTASSEEDKKTSAAAIQILPLVTVERSVWYFLSYLILYVVYRRSFALVRYNDVLSQKVSVYKSRMLNCQTSTSKVKLLG